MEASALPHVAQGDHPEEYAVVIHNAQKTRPQNGGKHLMVFRNLNFTLPKGCIYGLLGPSGCGKTTLFRCILGLLPLDEGTIKVFGHPPGSKESGVPGQAVGYMPQEIAVYDTLTIAECLWYYGTILGVSKSVMKSKIKYFIELLNLPPRSTIARNLSGGEIRRVSLAMALVHEPPLLILDEPTVGIDPILKESIWNHLVHLSLNIGTSILISTHYIEEARKANKVGLMHNRTLAVEDSTENLIQNCGHSSLEDVFLELCTKGNSGSIISDYNDSGDDERTIYEGSKCKRFALNLSNSLSCTFGKPIARWSVIRVLFLKNFINLYRFSGALLFAVILPCIQVLMATYAFGSAIGGIRLIVNNEDSGQFGDVYLSNLNPEVIYQTVNNVSHNQNNYDQRTEHYGVLQIGKNFSECLQIRLIDFPVVNKESIEGSEISLQVDNSNFYVNKIIQMEVVDSFLEFIAKIAPLISINSNIAKPVIHITKETFIYFRKPASMILITGMMMIPAYFASAAVIILSQFVDFNKGHIERSFVAGVTTLEIYLGLTLLQSLISILQMAGLLLASLPTLSMVNKGPLLLIFCCLYIHGLGGMSYGFFLSVSSDQVFAVTLYGTFSLVFTGVISGVFWPLEAMPYFLQYISLALPMALPVRALDFIIHRGWGICHLQVLLGLGISVVWMVIFFALALVLHSRKIGH